MGHLYSAMKIFHYQTKLDSLPRRVKQIEAPIHLRVKPTNVCNHHCTYCAYRADQLQLGQHMVTHDTIPLNKLVEIIEDLQEMNVRAVTFSGGGEPFCHPQFAKFLTLIAATRVRFAAITNGSKLNGEAARIFAQSGTWLRISIDGWDDASYANYRNVNRSEFSNVLHNAATFKKMGGPCRLGFNIIVNRMNAGHLFALIQKLKETGADSVKLSPCVVDNDGEKNNAYHAPIFERVKTEITQAIQALQSKSFEIYDAYHTLATNFAKSYSWCPFCQILAVIGADLNIYACQDKAYNIPSGCLGSIRQRRLKDFWYADKTQFFKINPSKMCDHHCVANAKNQLILDYLNTDPEHKMFV